MNTPMVIAKPPELYDVRTKLYKGVDIVKIVPELLTSLYDAAAYLLTSSYEIYECEESWTGLIRTLFVLHPKLCLPLPLPHHPSIPPN